MRIQHNEVTALVKNLIYTRSGVVWACWRLQGLPYAYASKGTRQQVRDMHEALFQGLSGEALLLGLCATLDPITVADRMLKDVNLAQHPDWGREVEMTLDSLEQIPVGTRAFWLCVPLVTKSWKAWSGARAQAAMTIVNDALGLPRSVPAASDVAEQLKAAAHIEERIPGMFKPARATAAEIIWMAAHAQQRGLGVDQIIPSPDDTATQRKRFHEDRETDLSDYASPSAFPNPLLDEGGQADLTKKTDQFMPWQRRYLKVSSPVHDQSSYQVMQALVGAPHSGWAMEGAEWMARLDAYDIPIDWALRLQIRDRDQVRRANKRAENNLDDQLSQQSGKSGAIIGGTGDLEETAATLAAYHQALNLSDKEVEVQSTAIIAVGAATPDEAKAAARFIRDDFKQAEFIWEDVLGEQENLWWAMQPGIPTTRIVRDLSQITTAHQFASTVPLASVALGDETGILAFENISTGRGAPVLLDIEAAIAADVSGCMGIVAELGAGKSVALKTLCGNLIDRGARVFAIDRTEAREYAHWASSLVAERTAVIDLLQPTISLDPLRLFPIEEGTRIVQSLFATMLGLKVKDSGGVALSRLLAPESLTKHKITSLGALLGYLKKKTKRSEQEDRLLGLMEMIADKDFGAVIFDDSLPVLNLDATAIIPLTHGLELPDESELLNEHLFAEMSLEKIFGRSMYQLLTSIARVVCFRDRSQLALFVVDECHHVTSSPEGERDLRLFFRDGRKHNAAAIVASHDPADFGDERTRGLIKLRLVMRQTDSTLAKRALDWVGDLGADAARVKEVQEDISPIGPKGIVEPHRRGEGLLRDFKGEIGKVRKTLPLSPERREAVLTTPSTATMNEAAS